MAKTILIVDDSASLRQVISIAVKGAGYNVIEGCDGQDGLKKLDGTKIHLIISDVNMPNMNGVEATKHIREIENEEKLSRTPIIAVSASAFKEDKERFISAGMDDYIAKPIDRNELERVLRKFLS